MKPSAYASTSVLAVLPVRSPCSSERSSLPMPFSRSTQLSKLPPFPLWRHLARRSIISWKCSACFISWRSVPSAPSLPLWNAFGPSMIAMRGSPPSALRGSSGPRKTPWPSTKPHSPLPLRVVTKFRPGLMSFSPLRAERTELMSSLPMPVTSRRRSALASAATSA